MNILDKICQLKKKEINLLKKKFKPSKKKNTNKRISEKFSFKGQK